jgi:A/G-specific adenine glycosylase
VLRDVRRRASPNAVILGSSGKDARRAATMVGQKMVILGKSLDNLTLKQFRESLLGWFHDHQRRLPWRNNRDPYRVWISEIMLQQTRVAAVIPYYEKFLERFPDVKTLAEAPPDEVLRLWSGLGYYSRARNLQNAAQQIVAKHAGKFPGTRDEVLALSGIGAYTAAAILSIAFGERLAAVDGNVARVLSRLEAIHGDLREPERWRELQSIADRLVVPGLAGDWNQAMMELGATVCTPRSPQCLLCPVWQFCQARKLGIAESLPEPRKKRASVAVHLMSVVLLDGRNNSLLLPPPTDPARNSPHDHVPSLVARLWHFPTSAPAKPSENALRDFLRRDLRMKDIGSVQPELLAKVRHTVTYRTISVAAYVVRVKRLPNISGAKSVPLEDTLSLSISNLTRKIARNGLQYLWSKK